MTRALKLQSSLLLLPLAVLLLADSAAAFRGGRIDFSGRENSCLNCHGSRQYDGLKFSLGSVAATEPCGFENEAGEFTVVDLPLLDFATTYPATVEIPEPSGADAPICPDNDCCDAANPPSADAACLDRPGARGGPMVCSTDDFLAGCCEPDLDNCVDAEGNPNYQAGFNAEVTGGGTFSPPERAPEDPAADTQLLPREGVVVENQITHTTAKRFEGQGVKWAFNFTTPPATATEAVQIYVGANVANGNFLDDNGDLNSNYQYAAVLTDGENYVFPGYCQLCSDGRSSIDGGCCSCTSTTPGSGVWTSLAVLSMLGFVTLRRRRRQR